MLEKFVWETKGFYISHGSSDILKLSLWFLQFRIFFKGEFNVFYPFDRGKVCLALNVIAPFSFSHGNKGVGFKSFYRPSPMKSSLKTPITFYLRTLCHYVEIAMGTIQLFNRYPPWKVHKHTQKNWMHLMRMMHYFNLHMSRGHGLC